MVNVKRAITLAIIQHCFPYSENFLHLNQTRPGETVKSASRLAGANYSRQKPP